MGKNWAEYLEENKVIVTEATIEMMVDACIKNGKNKKGAMEFAESNDYPIEVSKILKRLPKSMFENMEIAEVTFVELMEDYEGDLTQMIDDYLTESEELDEEQNLSNKFDEEKDELDNEDDDEDDDEDEKGKKKKKKKKEDDEFDKDDLEDDDLKKKTN